METQVGMRFGVFGTTLVSFFPTEMGEQPTL